VNRALTGDCRFGFCLGDASGQCCIRSLVVSLGQRWWTMRHRMVGWFARRRWWTMRHPMVGWFDWTTPVDDAASDGWLVRLGSACGRCGIRWLVRLGDAGGRCGIRWLVGSLGQRRWTMRHPMVGWFDWTAPVDDAASDGWLVRLGSAGGRCGIRWLVGSLGQRWWDDAASADQRYPNRAKFRRVGAAERGTRRFPGFQDHYSIGKCWRGRIANYRGHGLTGIGVRRLSSTAK